jgi:DNA-binding Xre family transcriptional regulator
MHINSRVSTTTVDQTRQSVTVVIRFRLKELVAEREFKEGRVITLSEIAASTGIHRATLSKIANERGYNTGTENIDRLCTYFECAVSDVIEYLPKQ